MQKNSTRPKKTDSISENKRLKKSEQLQPQAATLQKILQFASTYKAQRINDNQYIELFMN